MRIYFFKGPVVVFGLLFPLIMFLTFFIGRNLDLVLFFPGFLVDLFHAALNGDAVYPPWVDVLVLVVLVFILSAKVILERNLVKGI